MGGEEQARVRYSSRQEVVERGIVPALGDFGGDYDVDAICDDAFGWAIDVDDHGRELLNTGGFEQTVTDEEFWLIVRRHDLSARGEAGR